MTVEWSFRRVNLLLKKATPRVRIPATRIPERTCATGDGLKEELVSFFRRGLMSRVK